MITNKAPQLCLTPNEKAQLRDAKIKLASLADFLPSELARVTNMPVERCIELIVLSQFQSLNSVGPSLAQDLYDLGFRDINSLKTANPHQLFMNLEALRSKSIDPCVEDVFRCAVAQAKNPKLPKELKQWWYWTEKRGEG